MTVDAKFHDVIAEAVEQVAKQKYGGFFSINGIENIEDDGVEWISVTADITVAYVIRLTPKIKFRRAMVLAVMKGREKGDVVPIRPNIVVRKVGS